jgi:hypothetical protein
MTVSKRTNSMGREAMKARIRRGAASQMETAASELGKAADNWRAIGEELLAATCEAEAGRVRESIPAPDNKDYLDQ